MSNNKGYIYIFSNPAFDKDVFKIGKAQNVFQRMQAFTTGYIEPLKVEYISDVCNNYHTVESEVHLRLKRYRIKTNREFFKVKLETAIESIINVVSELNKLPDRELKHYHDVSYEPKLELQIDQEIIDSEDILEIKTDDMISQFLEHICILHSKKSEIEISCEHLFTSYEKFLLSLSIKNNISILKFGVRLKNLKLKCISKGQRTKKGNAYVININELKKHFKLDDHEDDDEDDDILDV